MKPNAGYQLSFYGKRSTFGEFYRVATIVTKAYPADLVIEDGNPRLGWLIRQSYASLEFRRFA
jgi:hypothetical protein